jgi:hypothetical protein
MRASMPWDLPWKTNRLATNPRGWRKTETLIDQILEITEDCTTLEDLHDITVLDDRVSKFIDFSVEEYTKSFLFTKEKIKFERLWYGRPFLKEFYTSNIGSDSDAESQYFETIVNYTVKESLFKEKDRMEIVSALLPYELYCITISNICECPQDVAWLIVFYSVTPYEFGPHREGLNFNSTNVQIVPRKRNMSSPILKRYKSRDIKPKKKVLKLRPSSLQLKKFASLEIKESCGKLVCCFCGIVSSNDPCNECWFKDYDEVSDLCKKCGGLLDDRYCKDCGD